MLSAGWATSLVLLFAIPTIRQDTDIWIWLSMFLISIPGALIMTLVLGALIEFFKVLDKWLMK